MAQVSSIIKRGTESGTDYDAEDVKFGGKKKKSQQEKSQKPGEKNNNKKKNNNNKNNKNEAQGGNKNRTYPEVVVKPEGETNSGLPWGASISGTEEEIIPEAQVSRLPTEFYPNPETDENCEDDTTPEVVVKSGEQKKTSHQEKSQKPGEKKNKNQAQGRDKNRRKKNNKNQAQGRDKNRRKKNNKNQAQGRNKNRNQ